MLALKNNSFQSKVYLRITIFSNRDLKYKDHGVCNSWTIKEDIYVEQTSNFTINKGKINAEINDIVYVTDSENKLVYLGLVDTIEADDVKIPIGKINVKPMISFFDLNIFLKEFKFEEGKLGSLIKKLIDENFVHSEDEEFNREYFCIEITDETDNIIGSELEIKQDQELSFLKLLKTIYDTFEVYLTFDLDLESEKRKLKISITKDSNRYNLRDNLADIFNLKLSNLYNQTVNRLVFYDKNYQVKYIYFLLKNNQVLEKNEIKDPEQRIYPIVSKSALLKESDKNKEKLTDEEDEKEKAKNIAEQELKGNIYSHLIQFNILASTKIIDLDQLKLRDKVTIYINNETYESVLSAYEYKDNQNILSLSLGKSRLLLTDRLKLGNY